MLKINKGQILLAAFICLKPMPSFGMEIEKENKNDNSSSFVTIPKAQEDNIDGFTGTQIKETDEYVQTPQKLLTDLLTDLREKGKEIYKFNIPSNQDTSMRSHAGKFKEMSEFLLKPKKFCKEEIEVTNSMVLFNNYYSAKESLTSLYKPIEVDFTSYLQRLSSKPFLEKKQEVEIIYNGGLSFTLLDTSKQEFWFREFYNGKENFEQVFSQFITSPMRTAAKCYILAKEKGEFISLFSHGFTGKCAADKMEHLLAWFSNGKKGKFAKSANELEDSSELSDINYQLKLHTNHQSYQVLAQVFVNSLLNEEHRKKDKVVNQQHELLQKMDKSNDENFQKVVNYFYKKFLDINKNNNKIKINVKKNYSLPVYIVRTGSKVPNDTKHAYVLESDFRKALEKNLIEIYYLD